MGKPEPAWLMKWRELEKLVDKKYEEYCAVVGLSIHQFNEPAMRHFHIHLTFRNTCSGELYIGGGNSRLAAINQAIATIKANKEAELSQVHYVKRGIREHEMRQIQH